MKNLNIIKIPVCLLFFYSCVTHSNQNQHDEETNSGSLPVISFEKAIDKITITGLRDVGSSITYIPLESVNQGKLGNLQKIIVTDSHIAINDSENVFMYDSSGRFLRRIGEKGQGKGKYQNVLDFCFSLDEQKIYILAFSLAERRYLEYEINGNFVTETVIDSVPTQILPLTNELFAFHCGNYPAVMVSSVDQSLIITDLKSKWRYHQNYHKRSNNAEIAVLRSPFYLHQGNIRFKEYGCDTLFTVTEEKLIPYSIFHLGKVEMPPDVSLKELQSPKYSGHVWILNILKKMKITMLKWQWGQIVLFTDSIINPAM